MAVAPPKPASRFAAEHPPPRHRPPAADVDRVRTKSWVRRMLPIVRAHRVLVVSGLGCALVMLLLQIAIPRVVMDAIDKGLSDRQGLAKEPLAPYIWVLLGLGALRLGLGYVYRLNLNRTAFAIEYDLRAIIYEHLTRLSFSYYDRVQTGQLISRANSDIRSVQMFLAFAPLIAVTFLSFFAAFAVMATIHLPLSIVAVITMPLVYVTGARMRRLLFPVSWIVSSRQADVATIVEENVSGTRVVKSFAGERQQVRALDDAAERLRWGAELQVEIRARYAPLMQNLPRIGFVLVLVYGGWLATRDEVSVGALVAFNAYIVMLQAPFMMLGFLMMLAQRAAASAGRIFEILDAEPEVVDRPGAIDLVDPVGRVNFDDVHFGYGDGPDILRGLSLHLAPGDTVALVGRTGSGKSTVARLLPRFYDTRRGTVRVDGHDVADLTLASLRAAVGLVLDEPFLFSESIRDNIAYGRPDAPMDDIVAAARAAGALEFIDRLPDGFDTIIGERGYTLSGGQRQRVAIARTLLVNPPVLILDDATSAIDVQVELEIHDALRTLMQGRTTLIIAHRLSTISLADRVVLLQDGVIAASGTHSELMATVPAYAEVLARAEEEYATAHAVASTPDEDLTPRQRAVRRLAQSRAEDGARGGDVNGLGGVG